jgi:hypothetical protein
VAVLVASDETRNPGGEIHAAAADRLNQIRRDLRRAKFSGGQDNLPALEAAWDLASAAGSGGAVLWIHLPNPVLLSAESGLRQRIERSASDTRLFELQVQTGPDRIVEKLDGLRAVQRVVHGGSVKSDVERLLAGWSGRSPRFEMIRERISDPQAGGSGPRVSRHIERLWARDEAQRLSLGRKLDDAVRLAARQQLVTSVTGAVVLETREQFERHGLTPVDAATVPAIPEPGSAVLMLLGFGLWWMRRRRT